MPQRRIVVLSPHYDDVALMLGGWLAAFARPRGKAVHVDLLFSRSNYQARSPGNADRSLARIQHATGIRLMEDLCYFDAALGPGAYRYELAGLSECVLRGKAWKPGEAFEFPHGNRETFAAEDWELFPRLTARCAEWLRQDGIAIVAPLAVKEHVDHVLTREALVEARRGLGAEAHAAVYFAEDQPYTGLASDQDHATAQAFIAALGLVAIDYPIDAAAKAEAVMRHYPSQVEDSYRDGVLRRARELSRATGFAAGTERLYRWDPS